MIICVQSHRKEFVDCSRINHLVVRRAVLLNLKSDFMLSLLAESRSRSRSQSFDSCAPPLMSPRSSIDALLEQPSPIIKTEELNEDQLRGLLVIGLHDPKRCSRTRCSYCTKII